MRQEDHPGIEVINEDLEARVRELRAQQGRDIWLYGGGILFSRLLARNLVDTVELAVIPILLGSGIPFLPSLDEHRVLTLIGHQAYPSGMVVLEYEVRSPDSS